MRRVDRHARHRQRHAVGLCSTDFVWAMPAAGRSPRTATLPSYRNYQTSLVHIGAEPTAARGGLGMCRDVCARICRAEVAAASACYMLRLVSPGASVASVMTAMLGFLHILKTAAATRSL